MRGQDKEAPGWGLDRIPLASIEPARVRSHEDLFYLVAAASLVESGAALYAGNLAIHFAGDDEVVDWLGGGWQVEEQRHGEALRAYVCRVWPEFDWERAYAAFLADYARQCTLAELEPMRSLEMAARCMIETGTAIFYEGLAAQAVEPVLAGIATRIRADEINHYKHFYRYFRRYRDEESPGRVRVAAALAGRLFEARRGDGECALWHAFVVRTSPRPADEAEFRALGRRIGARLRRYCPVGMAARMMLKPLDLPTGLARALHGPLSRCIGLALR